MNSELLCGTEKVGQICNCVQIKLRHLIARVNQIVSNGSFFKCHLPGSYIKWFAP